MNSRETGKRDRDDRERAAQGRTRTGFRKTGGPPRRSGEAHPLRPIRQRNRRRAKRHLAAARARAWRWARRDLAGLQQRGAGAVAMIAIGGGQLAIMRCIRRCVVVSVDMMAEVLCPSSRLVAAIRRCHAPAREERHENQQQQGQPTTHRGESSSALLDPRRAVGLSASGPCVRPQADVLADEHTLQREGRAVVSPVDDGDALCTLSLSCVAKANWMILSFDASGGTCRTVNGRTWQKL